MPKSNNKTAIIAPVQLSRKAADQKTPVTTLGPITRGQKTQVPIVPVVLVLMV